ncbi:MAG TPA: PKD domain-containing protein [Euryarchaeota archaeon]|nr:PKD domain-containing protein [Euryarchaeota archaeon]
MHPGIYLVTLTVWDDAGFSDQDTMTVEVLDITPPVADAGRDRRAPPGTLVEFDARGSHDNVGIVNYTWFFNYNFTEVVLYGVTPTYIFEIEGVYNITLTVKDAAGNENNDVTIINVTMQTYTINLIPGWNLISIPTMELNWDIDILLGPVNGKYDRIQTYDEVTGLWFIYDANAPYWVNTLSALDGASGYWIFITGDENVELHLFGQEREDSFEIQLLKGWNLVSYPSLRTDLTISQALAGVSWDIVQQCDQNRPYNLRIMPGSENIEPGRGYWIHVISDHTWQVAQADSSHEVIFAWDDFDGHTFSTTNTCLEYDVTYIDSRMMTTIER